MPKTETFDRKEVLAKITDLFWENGYNGTSMQDIVNVSGLNRSSIYNSFGDKHQLFTQAFKYYQLNIQAVSLEKALQLPPRQALTAIFEGVLFAFKKNANHKGCFMTNCTTELASHDRLINSRLHDNMDELLKIFGSILQKGKTSGEFSKDLPVDQTALYLFSSVQGLRLTAMLIDSEKELKGLINSTLKNI